MSSFLLLDTINHFPVASDAEDVRAVVERLLQRHHQDATLHTELAAICAHPTGRALLHSIACHSPHLTRLIEQQPAFFIRLCRQELAQTYTQLTETLETYEPLGSAQEAVMRDLRIYKNQVALLTAIADICELWTLEEITRALSDFAEHALSACCRFLLHRAQEKGELSGLHMADPEQNSGIILLGLGKLGGHELNYSSDIDIMCLYDPEKLRYTGRHTLQHHLSRMVQELVRMMQERTLEGYVFRTDLRLRPDPASTPPAISIAAALTYYESVGQNWERAALIKARAIAGDIQAGEDYLREIAPFIWRKHLDFAAIADIQSIKRQMTPQHNRPITLPKHNIKTGRGGIREIEFLAQIYQLIWGGRLPNLRIRATCTTLHALTEAEIILPAQRDELIESYHFFRRIEHRLQMIGDQQTHTIPETENLREELAYFLGYDTRAAFEHALLTHLERIHHHYRTSFSESSHLGEEGNLVFTGVELDPDTLETLHNMGFAQPKTVASLIQAWHHGKRRATRTKRARELITELTPQLLRHFAATAHPDQAFLRLDEFIDKAPAGVQIFSLFAANPNLLALLATIMGYAPALAERLTRAPELLDIVLTADFYSADDSIAEAGNALTTALQSVQHFEEILPLLLRYRNEQSFLIGVQLIRQQLSVEQASTALSALAEHILATLQHAVEAEFAKTYGHIPGGALSIVALGKLGTRELTFGSDLDLVFVYHADDMNARSDGARPFTASVYYNRLCQRIVGALTALDRGGRLYEIDTRLRPAGKDGSLAVSLQGFAQYFDRRAWTFEFMTLTKARVITGPESLQQPLQQCIAQRLLVARDAHALAADIGGMRQKVASEFPTTNPWDVKHVGGGVMDLEFLLQYFILLHAHRHPEMLHRKSDALLPLLAQHGIITTEQRDALRNAAHLLHATLSVLRLCGAPNFNPATAPAGLKTLLVRLLGAEDFSTLERTLLSTQTTVATLYRNFIETPK